MTTPATNPALTTAVTTLFHGSALGVRDLLTESLGKTLTPELAASIELASRGCHFTDRVNALVAQMINLPPSVNPITHLFADGIVARKIELAAGDTVVGAPHRIENIVVILKGVIELATPAGKITLVQGDMLACRPGTQNTVVAVEDSAWVNFFANPTNTQVPDELLSTLSSMHPDDAHGGKNNVQVKANQLALEKEAS